MILSCGTAASLMDWISGTRLEGCTDLSSLWDSVAPNQLLSARSLCIQDPMLCVVQVCEQKAGRNVGLSEVDHAAMAVVNCECVQFGCLCEQEYETAMCPRPSFPMAIGREQAHPGETAAPGRGRKHEVQKSEQCAGCTVGAQRRVSSRYTNAKPGKVLNSKTSH